MGVAPDALLDLVNMAQDKVLSGSQIHDISQLYHHYNVYPALREAGSDVFIESGSGTKFEWKVKYQQSATAENIQPYTTLDVSRQDVTTKAESTWTFKRVAYMVDELELAMNKSPEKIFDLVETNRYDAIQGFANKSELEFSGKPATSADTLTPHGLFSHIVPATAGQTTVVRRGGNPAGFDDGVGLDSDTYLNWKNCNVLYTNPTPQDLYDKLKRMWYALNWSNPIKSSLVKDDQPRFEILTNITGALAIETLVESNNENFGKEAAPFSVGVKADFKRTADGTITFRGIPIRYYSLLDDNTYATDPYLFVDWNALRFVPLDGYRWNESKMARDNAAPTVMIATIISAYQFIALYRHTLGCVNKV
jgi:hypothetical protein